MLSEYLCQETERLFPSNLLTESPPPPKMQSINEKSMINGGPLWVCYHGELKKYVSINKSICTRCEKISTIGISNSLSVSPNTTNILSMGKFGIQRHVIISSFFSNYYLLKNLYNVCGIVKYKVTKS